MDPDSPWWRKVFPPPARGRDAGVVEICREPRERTNA
jgi:hypothetical protein